MLAICRQKIVPIPYTAKLGPVQAQPPQRCHAFGLPGQMRAVTISGHVRSAAFCGVMRWSVSSCHLILVICGPG